MNGVKGEAKTRPRRSNGIAARTAILKAMLRGLQGKALATRTGYSESMVSYYVREAGYSLMYVSPLERAGILQARKEHAQL